MNNEKNKQKKYLSKLRKNGGGKICVSLDRRAISALRFLTSINDEVKGAVISSLLVNEEKKMRKRFPIK